MRSASPAIGSLAAPHIFSSFELHAMRDSPRAISIRVKRRRVAMSIRAIVRSAVKAG
jgi:hypothetical protein